MSLKIYTKAIPKGFKSIALENTLRNLGKLPLQLGKLGSMITGQIKLNLSGRILQKRSGALYDSWLWTVQASAKGWQLIIGSDVDYARIHNMGGFTGRNYATKIKKTRYVDRAVIKKKAAVRRLLQDYMVNITRG